MTTMTKSECWEQNLIKDDGFCSPFVAKGDDDRIYVGDCDNIDSFTTADEAIAHCNGAILSGTALDTAKHAHENNYQNNDAAEYQWHCDAEMQIDALRTIE